jgi:hypothetical protein
MEALAQAQGKHGNRYETPAHCVYAHSEPPLDEFGGRPRATSPAGSTTETNDIRRFSVYTPGIIFSAGTKLR